jgi:hypothetical protein
VDYVDGGGGAPAKIVVASPVAVERRGDPAAVRFLPIDPDPFRDAVVLRFELPRRTTVDLAVLDPAGRRVRTLAASVAMEAGVHALAWDGRDAGESKVPAGLYLCRLVAGDIALVRRVIRLP